MGIQVRTNGRVIAWANEHNSDATGIGGHDVGIFRWSHCKTDACQKCRSRCEINDCNDDMIDANGNSVECAEQCVCDFDRLDAPTIVSHFDAMCFGKHDAKQLFGKVGINSAVDCPLASRRQHFAYSLWLNHRSRCSSFYFGDFFAHFHALSEQCNNRSINLVDLLAELWKIACHLFSYQ